LKHKIVSGKYDKEKTPTLAMSDTRFATLEVLL